MTFNMKTKKLVGRRFSFWFKTSYLKGRTGIVIENDPKYPVEEGEITVILDGDNQLMITQPKWLYFPDHLLGYNQECFNQ